MFEQMKWKKRLKIIKKIGFQMKHFI
jgi:hypothetical protein